MVAWYVRNSEKERKILLRLNILKIWNYDLIRDNEKKKVIFKLFLDMELKEVIVFGYQVDVV